MLLEVLLLEPISRTVCREDIQHEQCVGVCRGADTPRSWRVFTLLLLVRSSDSDASMAASPFLKIHVTERPKVPGNTHLISPQRTAWTVLPGGCLWSLGQSGPGGSRRIPQTEQEPQSVSCQKTERVKQSLFLNQPKWWKKAGLFLTCSCGKPCHWPWGVWCLTEPFHGTENINNRQKRTSSPARTKQNTS